MVTPAGPIAEPLAKFKTLLTDRTEWQTWAGVNYLDRVYLSENRSQIETDGASLLWMNTELSMPFSIIWMPSLAIDPKRCLYQYNVLMMFQDKATSRQDHDDSANTFATNAGTVLDAISTHIREGTDEVPNVDEITMPGEPTRVGLNINEPQHDFWTTTFMFKVNT